ncbi:MAG: hypothetical protein K2F69_00300 [Bacteroidaceae bacterium]|nr:hypothetical protein [Bacteroidaceae bacterium]
MKTLKNTIKAATSVAKLLLLAAALLVASCGEELTQNKWSRMRAYYLCDHVMDIPTLYHACTGPDQWCTIRLSLNGKQLLFESLIESDTENLTANVGYTRFHIERGLIIGLPSLAEPLADAPVVTCYDIACPNCLDDAISKNLTIQENGKAKCSRCNRTYDLSNQGIVSEGERGKTLERYRVNYNGNTLIVDN